MQLDLQLEPRFKWGGCRAGAGRKRSPRSRMPHLRRPEFPLRHPCHVTLRLREGIPSLRSVRLVRELEKSFRAARERDGFRLVHYSLQSNHAQLLVEAAGPDALARGMKSLGARIARAANRIFRLRGAVLADRYHARALRTPREVRNALRYVLLNARRHLGHFAPGAARIDPASSGRWFDGWRGDLSPGAKDPPAVASARSWLLAVGWRRHGLIAIEEMPCGVPAMRSCMSVGSYTDEG